MLVSAGPIISMHVSSGKKNWFSGHEEIELALVKLFRVTNDERYLKLADWYLQRGEKVRKL